jgi:hypothetical protein
MRVAVAGGASLHLVSGVALLRPDEQVFEAMLDGWRNQQLARNLQFSTIEQRENAVRAFVASSNTYPWNWSPQLVDEWLGDGRAVRGIKHTTVRNYQNAVRLFCSFVTDPVYGWAEECISRFGTHPVQVVHEWNTAEHVQANEGDARKRAFTRGSCRTCSPSATKRWSGSVPRAARGGCRRSATRRC